MRSLLSLTSLHCVLQLLLGRDNAKKLLEESDRYSNTPLHIAARKGFINIVNVCYQDLKCDVLVIHLLVRWEKLFSMFEVSFQTTM